MLLIVAQKFLTMIDVMFLAIPYTSPHICKVVPLFKWNRSIITCVSTWMHNLMQKFALPNDGTTILHKYWKV
jgi:hypothetical protein